MDSNKLHLLFKFTEQGRNGFKTMEEHIKVSKKYKTVIWGHFSSSKTKKGLWQEKIQQMTFQIKNNKETFVFFYDKKNSLLYSGRYIKSWSSEDFNLNHEKINLVPAYYHNAIGLPPNGQLRSYCYVEVDNIKKLSIQHIEEIISSTSGESVDKNGGQSSVFYVNLNSNLEHFLDMEYLKFNENIESEEKEAIIVQEILKSSLAKKIDDIPKNIPKSFKEFIREKSSRDSSVIANAIVFSNFKCEVDSTHKSFISKKTNQQFLEGHHLIPLAYQEDFSYSLDVESNVVALCPNCHRLLHHGTDEEKLIFLENLFDKRKNRLSKANIKIDLRKLKKCYL